MSSFRKKTLKVVEKFRAPAALYYPSRLKGDGWIEVSGPSLGGEAVIQLQGDAKQKSGNRTISVFRFQLRHGKDHLNARIQHRLPIHRKGETTVLFKSASTNSGGLRKKSVYAVKFQSKDDTNDFMMWWLAKNGSTSLGEETKNTSKRKAEDKTGCDRGSGYTPQKKKSKQTKSCPPANGVLNNSTNSGCEESPERGAKGKIVSSLNSTSNNSSEAKELDSVGTKNDKDDDSSDSDSNEEVAIDDEYAPRSQQWVLAFVEKDE